MTVTFAPLLPLPFLLPLLAIAAVLLAIGLFMRLRGMVLRTAALVLLALALLNPALQLEDRETLSTIVPIVVDRSASQASAERRVQTDSTLEQLQQQLAKFAGIELRIITASDDPAAESPATRLFSALANATADVPPSRIGATIFITDGQIHDIPSADQPLSFSAPVHGLITGHEGEFDRRIDIVRAPRFGIVGQQQEVTFRIVEDGPPNAAPADVTVRMNGTDLGNVIAIPGKDMQFSFKIPRGGNNVLEFSLAATPDEISTANNRTTRIIDGIRQNLRVLLVSGEPHAGERAWRNLLKSDASVDLVHFTILRPPEKQDGTPINELSLIAFPTRELFVEKIDQFDLIIFDRYRHRGVLPILYYDYIAEYVKKGGALLIAAGPEHAGDDSIANTPLAAVLPAAPTGTMDVQAFYPRLSETGKKHPVTRGLEGADGEPPRWGRWFRTVDVAPPQGETVMVGADNHPLLVLNRAGEGRVAMLLSDQGWLWSRGFEGGGPYVSLYRRIAHWLMREPDLEEEALTARATGRSVEITRQTIGTDPGQAEVTFPSGKTATAQFTLSEPGLYRATLPGTETGLYAIKNADLSALVHVGAVDAPEFKAAISTTESLKPIAGLSGGLVVRVSAPPVAGNASTIELPQIVTVRGEIRETDSQRLQIRLTSDTVLKGVSQWPLIGGFLGLAALLLALSATWWREGR